MARPAFASVQAWLATLRSILATFREQRLSAIAWLAIAVFVLALVFAFLAFVPILSPFVYPLF